MRVEDYVVLALVALILFCAVRRSVRRKRAGTSCCGGCAGCGAAERCEEHAKRR